MRPLDKQLSLEILIFRGHQVNLKSQLLDILWICFTFYLIKNGSVLRFIWYTSWTFRYTSLDVNDACKRPIAKLTRYFCLWRNNKNVHNPRKQRYSNKLPRNGNSKAKTKLQKKSVYRSYQAHLMGWMHLMIFTLIIHS